MQVSPVIEAFVPISSRDLRVTELGDKPLGLLSLDELAEFLERTGQRGSALGQDIMDAHKVVSADPAGHLKVFADMPLISVVRALLGQPGQTPRSS
jgi:hypothetical protein